MELLIDYPDEQYKSSGDTSTAWPTRITSTDVTESILIVDSDATFFVPLSDFLIDNGYSVEVQSDGTQALDRIGQSQPMLVTLEHRMPEIDGLTICRLARAVYQGPIIMMCGSTNAIDEVAGLEVGADNFLAKSVQPRVMLAYIRAQLRRHESKINLSDSPGSQPITPSGPDNRADFIELGALCINQSARKVSVFGREAHLTDAEFELLCLLSKHAGHPVTRSTIARELRGLEHDGFDRTIDLRISRIRKKLGDDPRYPSIIRSVRGVGYLVHR